MERFDISNFKLGQHYVIQASAGTGKTYQVRKIVRELLLKAKDVNLENILIVTYTEKATNELKTRIREEVKELYDELLAKNADPELIEKIHKNLLAVDKAPIYTIHGFCNAIISEFALTLNLPLNMEMCDQERLDRFIDLYIRDGELGDLIKRLSLIGRIDSDDIESLQKLFKKFANTYYLSSNLDEDESVISFKVVENEDLILNYAFAKTEEDVYNAISDLKDDLNYLYSTNCEHKIAFADDIKTHLFDGFDYNGKKFKETNKLLKNDPRTLEIFYKINKLKQAKLNKQVKVALSSKYCVQFYKDWLKEKETNKVQEFSDIIRNVKESIQGPVLEKIKGRFKYGIIDEFQDTNHLQFTIFSNIFLTDDEHSLIVVGDPKQSIYSFQGTDLQVYKNAINVIINKQGEMTSLNKNFRSSPEMVNVANKIFKHLALEDFYDAGNRNIKEDKFQYVATFDGKPLKALFTTKDKCDKYNFASTVIDFILSCCKKDEQGKTRLQLGTNINGVITYRNVTYKDFVFVGKKRTEFEEIIKLLKRVGIPYIMQKDGSLFSNIEALNWIILLRAINAKNFTGNNRKLFKKTLFTDFFGKNVHDLGSIHYERDDNHEMELIKLWKEKYVKNKLWENLIEDIISSSYLLSNLSRISDQNSLNKYRQIGDYCIEYLYNNHTLDDLIRNLTSLNNGATADDEDGGIVKKATNSSCVSLITMHSSKGLQFPIVICASGYKKAANNQTPIYIFHETGKKGLVLSFKKTNEYDKEVQEELNRLYYVAFTRSQYLLMIANPDKVLDKLDIPVFDALEAFYLEDDQLQLHEEIEVKEADIQNFRQINNEIISQTSVNDQNEKQAQIEKINHIKKIKNSISTFKHSYSTLSHGKHDTSYDDDLLLVEQEGEGGDDLSGFDINSKQINSSKYQEIEPLKLSKDYPKGASVGNALHTVFEDIDFTNYKDEVKQVIISKFLNEGIKANENWVDETLVMVDNVLSADLPVIKGSEFTNETFKLNSIPNVDKKAEEEFNFNVLDERLHNYLNGFVDLIFRRGDYYSILDWKSDKLNDVDFESYSSLEDLKSHTDKKYSIQRVLYTYCLINWLKNLVAKLENESEEDYEERIFKQHYGGIYYIYLRGCISGTSNGVYAQTWSSFNDVKEAFKKIVKERMVKR